jgi:hypothetical protein
LSEEGRKAKVSDVGGNKIILTLATALTTFVEYKPFALGNRRAPAKKNNHAKALL